MDNKNAVKCKLLVCTSVWKDYTDEIFICGTTKKEMEGMYG
jgi:hypothetical protein